MELSLRLQAVAALVSDGVTLADVGTDHGYVPIHLVSQGRIPAAIAMDINEGPLRRAAEHITECGLGNYIQTRLSDGVLALQDQEADSVVMAGMGGGLIIRIMEEGAVKLRQVSECILQPQSEIAKVRAYLCSNGYKIVEEDMVLEDGKFYPMMKVIHGTSHSYSRIELKYGSKLLQNRHPVLKQYLEKAFQEQEQILAMLRKRSGEHIIRRKAEVETEISCLMTALKVY